MDFKRLVLILASFGAAFGSSAYAQLTPDQQKILDLEKKIDELDKRLAAAEARLAPTTVAPTGPQRPTNAGSEAASTIPARPPNNVGLVSAGTDGFTIRSADGEDSLRIGVDLQTDVRTFTGTGSNALTDQMLLRRVRPTFSGTLYKDIDYFVRTDFGQGSVVLYEAYAQLNYIPHFAIRIGKFKPPVDLERLQSDDDTTFIERGLPTLLAPSRDIGFQLSGDIVSRRLGYQVGVFNGVPDNSLSDASPSSHHSYAARLFATPFQSETPNFMSGLGFGMATEGGSVDGVALPAYKTIGQNTFFNFSSGVTSAGHRTALAPQAFYYLGSFGLLAEDTVTEEEFQKTTVRKNVAFRAWNVELSYILTGEKKSYGSPIPKHPFSPLNNRWGAWELAARTGDFKVDHGLFNYGFASIATSPNFAREWVAGVNWYLNRVFRVDLDYAHTNFVGGAVNADRAAERAILARFQLNFI